MQNSISIEDTITVVRNFLRLGKINEALENLQIVMDSREINEKHELIIDILNIRILMELGQTEEAVALMEASSYGLNSDRFKPEYVEIQTVKAILYFLISKFDESELILSKTFTEIDKFNETDKNLCAESASELTNLHGLILSNEGDWDAAFTEFQKALSYRKKANHLKDIGMIHFNIANVYRYQQKPQLSISAFEEGINSFKDIDYVEGLEVSYNAIKEVYTEIGESDSAFLYKQKLDELNEKINFKKYVKEATISKNAQSREIERLNAEIIQNKQEVWSLKLELNSIHDAKHDGESFSAQIVDKTKEELDEAKKLITTLQHENDTLQTTIESQDQKVNTNSEVESKLADSLVQIKTLTEQVNHKIKEIENLNILVGKKKSEADEMQNVINEYQGKIETLEGESETKTKELETLEAESESKTKELETLKDELKVKSSAGESSTELQASKEKIAELQIELEDKEIEMKKLSEEVGLVGKDAEELEEATQKIVELQNALEAKDSSELTQATKKIAELENALETKDALIIKLGQKGKPSDSGSEDLTKANEQIAKLQIELEDKEIEMKKLSEEVGLVGKDAEELEEATQKIVELQNALETKDALIIKQGQKGKPSDSGSEDLTKANEQIAELQTELIDKDTQMEENLRQIEVTFEEVDALKARLKTLESKPSDTKVESDDDIVEIRKELKASKLEKEVLERQIKDIEAKHKVDLQNTIEEMKKVTQEVSESSIGTQVDTLNKQIKDLENTLKEKDLLVENSNSKVNELNYKVESLGLEVQKLKSENEGLIDKSSKVDEYITQIEELKSVQASAPSKITGSAPSFQATSTPTNLQDYLDSSKLAESIARILENQDSLKLRFLAMQIGTSPAKCMEEIKALRKIGFVDLEYDSAGDSNPLIVKK